MLAYQGRVTASTVDEAVEKVFAKYPGSADLKKRFVKLSIKEVTQDWYEYTIIEASQDLYEHIIPLEEDGDEV